MCIQLSIVIPYPFVPLKDKYPYLLYLFLPIVLTHEVSVSAQWRQQVYVSVLTRVGQDV